MWCLLRGSTSVVGGLPLPVSCICSPFNAQGVHSLAWPLSPGMIRFRNSVRKEMTAFNSRVNFAELCIEFARNQTAVIGNGQREIISQTNCRMSFIGTVQWFSNINRSLCLFLAVISCNLPAHERPVFFLPCLGRLVCYCEDSALDCNNVTHISNLSRLIKVACENAAESFSSCRLKNA